MDDPLLQIAGQVQDEIADAVHVGRRAPPDLFVRELANAMVDALKCGFEFASRGVADGGCQFIGVHVDCDPSAGAKNTSTVRSSVTSRNRCSARRSTKRIVPGSTGRCSPSHWNRALPLTT